MYEKTVTIFDYYESATTGDAYWYPHVLCSVDLITDKGAILKKYGPDATDNAQLHIRYTVQNGDITIADKDGKILPYCRLAASNHFACACGCACLVYSRFLLLRLSDQRID